ncbi:hypothetical protein QBC39DRAFT_367230 [Podospora conica]|nr:hypothetical protein QBC39DRAFT_367230 [Schizothecium conicum]
MTPLTYLLTLPTLCLAGLLPIRPPTPRGLHAYVEPIVPAIPARSYTTLHPIRSLPRKKSALSRRSLAPALTPQNSSTLAWLGPDGTLAEFTISSAADAAEAIVNLELLDPEDKFIRSIQCPPPGGGAGKGKAELAIRFAEAADLDDAADVWAWVNREEGNRFLVVVGEGECDGGNEGRRVFRVGGVKYLDAIETAVLEVDEEGWQAVGTFDLTVGRVGGAELRRRGFLDDLKGVADKVADGAKKAVEEVKKVPEKVADGAKKAVEDIKAIPDKITEGTKKAVDDIKAIPDKITEGTKKAVEDIKAIPDKITDGTKDAIEDLQKVPQQITDAIKDTPLDDIAKAIPIPALGALDDILNPGLQPDFSIPFANRFPSTPLSLDLADNVTVSAQCVDCFTTGSFDVKGRFRSVNLVMEEAWIELSTEGISARAVIALGLKGALVAGQLPEKSVSIFRATPAGIDIPGVLRIGPTVSVDMGVELSELSAGLNLVLGGTATIPASSSRLNFLKEGGSKIKGWKPSFKADPVQADGFVEVKAAAFIKPAIGLEISVVETGLTADISAKTPSLNANLRAIRSADCTVCGKFENGLQGGLTLGASIGASLKKKVLSNQDVLFGVTFAEAEFPIAGGGHSGE